MKAARASYIAGFSGTSNVLAGKVYHIPTSGTMAHSFITSFEGETEAFRAFCETFPNNAVLLIDTYDTVSGARKAVKVAKEMKSRGQVLKGVRLDSGDMAELSKKVREILRRNGLEEVSIFASGGFDEYKIADVLERGAEIDAFGVGTKMGASADGPFTDMAFKLVQYDGRPVLKLSSEKQVFRTTRDGRIIEDTIALRNEKRDGEPLLKPVMRGGKRLTSQESLGTIRERFRVEFAALDDAYKALNNPREFPVRLGPDLKKKQEEAIHDVIEKEVEESRVTEISESPLR
jgi:nicotinate phosphoribosyltransferase